MDFVAFPKIARLSRNIVITEKIDGTNASIHIGEDGTLLTGSRTRWITPEDDNHGFSRWAHEHKDELLTLGPGTHFGEWWGADIGRAYGLKEKRFSLFNTSRWTDPDSRPPCVGVVPQLYTGVFETFWIENACNRLRYGGSQVAPGFDRPEGIVIYHAASNTLFKKTLEKDEKPKNSTETP